MPGISGFLFLPHVDAVKRFATEKLQYPVFWAFHFYRHVKMHVEEFRTELQRPVSRAFHSYGAP